MSAFYLSVCPTDPVWQPTQDAAQRLEQLVKELVPDAEEIEVVWNEKIGVVDAGENLQRITCSACRGHIDVEWWADVQEEAFYKGGYDDLSATAPCCGARIALNELEYDWPLAYARFEVAALNPSRDWFTAQELAQLAQALGHPVTQVMAHI